MEGVLKVPRKEICVHTCITPMQDITSVVVEKDRQIKSLEEKIKESKAGQVCPR